jgi:hypothetical protein
MKKQESNIMESLNPKSEYRNPKQCSNFQNPNDQNKQGLENLRIRTFGFVSNFVLRASNLTKH